MPDRTAARQPGADTLLEAEFSGVAGGACTGANCKGRHGQFKLADGCTLFLDEIGDMPLPLQTKLLRARQEWQVEPLASIGRRSDLAHKSLSSDGLDRLIARHWPGNIGELRKALEQAALMTVDLRLTAMHLDEAMGVRVGAVRGCKGMAMRDRPGWAMWSLRLTTSNGCIHKATRTAMFSRALPCFASSANSPAYMEVKQDLPKTTDWAHGFQLVNRTAIASPTPAATPSGHHRRWSGRSDGGRGAAASRCQR